MKKMIFALTLFTSTCLNVVAMESHEVEKDNKTFTLTIKNESYDDTCYQQVNQNYGGGYKNHDGLRISIFGDSNNLLLPPVGQSYDIQVTPQQLKTSEYQIVDEQLNPTNMAHPFITKSEGGIPEHTTHLQVTIEKGQGVDVNGAGVCYPAGILNVIE